MQRERVCIGLRAALAIFTATVLVSISAAAQEKVLYNFNGTDGASPQANLVMDAAGNLYGTTQAGGTHNYGTVFELTPAGGGGWTETVLHNFTNGADGGNPQSGLVLDGAGNLYGTTYVGGAYCCGTAFELTPAGGGSWTEKVLYSFGSGNTAYPTSGLIFDGAGNLYGTTLQGGSGQGGSVYELIPAGGGTWTERDLHDFNSLASGIFPYGGVVFDGAGNLYGTTSTGGAGSNGTVFELAAGTWTMRILHNFTGGSDGDTPYAGLVFTGGNLYGTTSGINSSAGTVYELTPAGGGNWNYQRVHNFGSGADGSTPYAGLIADGSGNLYGTTLAGGIYGGGTVFRLNSQGEVVLHSFGYPEGYGPVASLILDAASNLYGSAQYGGAYGGGTVFEVAPPVALVAVAPCRVVDTRNPNGPFGGPPIQGGTSRSFAIPQGNCNIPAVAAAYSFNVTVVPRGPLGYLTIWPTGEGQPLVSTLNSPDGRTKANAAIVPAGASGAVSVYVTNTSDVILDIDGYFAPASSQAMQFYPLAPCRVVDTRDNTKPHGLGPPLLSAMQTRDLPILTSPCFQGLPNTPKAYSFNVTAVPNPANQPLYFLALWPDGPLPTVSTLNNPTATAVANAAIVPANPANGDIEVYGSNSTDLVIDVNGYFAAPASGGYSFYPVTPCRAYDSRDNGGQPFTGERTVPIVSSPCAPPSNAAAYVFNATVVPSGPLGFLTLWPDGETQPLASTLNAYDAFITSNLAIVPNTDGSTDTYAGGGYTQLILDIAGYFAP